MKMSPEQVQYKFTNIGWDTVSGCKSFSTTYKKKNLCYYDSSKTPLGDGYRQTKSPNYLGLLKFEK